MADKDFVVKNGLVVNNQLLMASAGKVSINSAPGAVTLVISANDAVLIPIGNTANRPAGANGMIRYNSQISAFEGFAAGAWQNFGGVSANNPAFVGVVTVTGQATVSQSMAINSTNVLTATLYANGGIRAKGGSAIDGTAGYNFDTTGDSTSGLYSPSAGTVEVWTSGAKRISVANDVITTSGSIKTANISFRAMDSGGVLANTDSGGVITVNSSSAQTITAPSTLPPGFRCLIYRLGSGIVTVANGASVVLLTPGANTTISTQYGSASVFSPAAGTVIVDGRIG